MIPDKPIPAKITDLRVNTQITSDLKAKAPNMEFKIGDKCFITTIYPATKEYEITPEPGKGLGFVVPQDWVEIEHEWFTDPEKNPTLNTPVVVLFEDGSYGIGQLDDNDQRTAWLVQGTGKMYWRSFTKTIKQWREMTFQELYDYKKNGTLKFNQPE